MALSKQSPADPIERSMPAAAHCRVNTSAVYWLPRSECNTTPCVEYLRSFGLFGLWQLWQSSGPGGRVHFMIAEKSSDVKVQRVSRLAESKSRCCISHNFGGFYQIIPCIRPAVVRIKVAHGCPATIRIFILGRAVQAWQREPGGRPMPPAMEAKGARSTIRERGSRGQSLSPLRLSSK